MTFDLPVDDLSIDRGLESELEPGLESNGASCPALPGLDVTDTRQRILLAGLDRFAARGYHATSIRDIAAGAGLQSASLYTHFASKEAILTELVTLAYTVHNRALMTALVDSGPGPVEQLRRLIEAHVAAHCRWSRLAAVATREIWSLSPAAAAPALALRDSSVALMVEIIHRGLELGVFVVPELDITLSAIGSLGTATINWYPAQSRTYTPEQVGATYADLTLKMVGVAA